MLAGMTRVRMAGVGLLMLQAATVQAQPCSTEFEDASVSDAAASDAGDGAVEQKDAAPGCPVSQPPADASTPSPSEPGDAGDPSDPGEPDYDRHSRPLDPMQAVPVPYVEPPYTGRGGSTSHSEPPAPRAEPAEPDHSQACGCRFVRSEEPSLVALLAPLLGLLLVARRAAARAH
jgi:hypothetical protein